MAVDRKRAARLLWQLPRDCRVFKRIQPATEWGYSDIFQNKMVYLLETLVWQKSYDPKKKAAHMAAKPKLFVPEFMQKAMGSDGIKRDTVSLDVDEVKDLLAKPRK